MVGNQICNLVRVKTNRYTVSGTNFDIVTTVRTKATRYLIENYVKEGVVPKTIYYINLI